MKSILSFLTALALASSAFAKSKTIKAAPEAPAEKPRAVVSSISLNVRVAATGRTGGMAATTPAGGVRTTTEHRSEIEIGVANLGTQPETVTVRWFWVGRYEKSRNWFRTADGEKTFSLEPKKTEPPFSASGEIEEHDTKGATSSYKSGGHLVGWVVTARNPKGELVASRASLSHLEGFAADPPPKQRH